MISIGENRAVLCKGDFHPAQLYKGDKKIAGYTETEFRGTDSVTLENCYNDKVYDAQIEGVSGASITVRGKNLFNIQSSENLYKATYGTYSRTEKGFKVVCTSPQTSFRMNLFISKEVFEEGKTYTISCTGSNIRMIYVGEANDTRDTSSYGKYGSSNGKSHCFTVNDITKPYICFLIYGTNHNVGDTIIVEDIQLEDSSEVTTYEPYIEPQTILFENGKLTEEIPTFKGTTILEIESDIAAKISGKYKRME